MILDDVEECSGKFRVNHKKDVKNNNDELAIQEKINAMELILWN